MIIYLAGLTNKELLLIKDKAYILESFAYIKKHKKCISELLKHEFILDSGAFTFIGNNKKKIDWDSYTDYYIEFINKYDIKNYFELDIYSIVGLEETERLRKKIERATNKKSIPVWHIYLGIDYFKKMCENYSYIAIGASGRHDSKWTRSNPDKLKALIDYASSKKVRVHGLGYTNMTMLNELNFYSVDSTSWMNGSKYGEVQYFDGRIIRKESTKKHKAKTIDSKEIIKNNINQWLSYQKYMKHK
jgi:hypothetical protein